MFGCLVPVSLLLQTALIAARTPGRTREAFLKAAVATGLIAAGLTELLSLGSWLAFRPVLCAWALVLAAQLGGAARRRRYLASPGAWVSGAASGFKALAWEDRMSLALAGAAVVVCAATAFLSPPNNFDSMTYHMPRVMHWIQNRGVRHYPTNDLRQLAFPPGAGYLIVQLQILAGTDRFANGVQWLAFVGSIVGVSTVARGLGAGARGQVLAAALAASLPMAVLQAETTQYDLLTAFWLVCFAAFSLKEGRYELEDLAWLSASLGLAILTKPTGLVFGAPLLLIVWARSSRRLATVGGILALSFLMSAGWLWRNKTGLGSFLPEDGGTLKTVVGFRQTAACAVKNAAVELPVPSVWRGVLAVERRVLGLDPEDSGGNFDPQATRDIGAFCLRLALPDEDFAASPIHFLLFLWAAGSLGLALWRRKTDPRSDQACLMAGLMLGFLVFCALFKWQKWANRLMLPLSLLAMPLTARLLEPRLPGPARKLLLAGLGVCGLFYGATSVHRPLWALPPGLAGPFRLPSILSIDRETLYLTGYPKASEKPFRASVDSIVKSGCDHVGLDIGWNEGEYAWWAVLGLESRIPVRIESIGVANASAKLAPEFPSGMICAVVKTR